MDRKRKKERFGKGNDILPSPILKSDDLNSVSSVGSSFSVTELIQKYRSNFRKSKISFRDVSFIIPVRIDSKSRSSNLYAIANFLDKYFDTTIIIGESDLTQKVERERLPKKCRYFFLKDDNNFLHRTRLNNILIKKSSTKVVVLYDTDVVIPIHQLYQAVDAIRLGTLDMSLPYDGRFLSVDNTFKEVFIRVLNPELLSSHEDKFITGSRRSCGGAVIVDRFKYLKAGLENEFFQSWGPEDVERVKRMRNLGFNVGRIEGPLFHLPHERKENSNYSSMETRLAYMQEYLRICNMNATQMQETISSWPWLNED